MFQLMIERRFWHAKKTFSFHYWRINVVLCQTHLKTMTEWNCHNISFYQSCIFLYIFTVFLIFFLYKNPTEMRVNHNYLYIYLIKNVAHLILLCPRSCHVLHSLQRSTGYTGYSNTSKNTTWRNIFYRLILRSLGSQSEIGRFVKELIKRCTMPCFLRALPWHYRLDPLKNLNFFQIIGN